MKRDYARRSIMGALAMLVCAVFGLGVGDMPARAQSTPQTAYGAAIGNARLPTACNAQATQASILACRAQLLTTGGKIMLPAAAITLTAPLPVDSNIWYVGTQPNGAPQSVDPGDNWTAAPGQPGTLLIGDGTFPAFAGKNSPLGSPDDGTTAIYNWGLENVTIKNVSYAVQVGATNSFGLFHSHIYNVWVDTATQWAFDVENTGFDEVLNIYMRNSANCFHWVDSLPSATYNPTNSYFRRLFCYSSGNKMRGVVFEVTNPTGIMGGVKGDQIQVNDFANFLVTQAATMANASPTIAVTDGTQFAVGMPVSVSATANGFTLNQIYFVLSISGNNLTLGNSRSGAAINATGSTAVNIVTYGFSALELVSAVSPAQLLGIELQGLDLEGRSSCTIYVENTNSVWLQGTAINPTAFSHVCLRTALNAFLDFNNGNLTYDLDGNSGTSTQIMGVHGVSIQRNGFGIYRDPNRVVNCLMLSAANTGGKCDLESVPLSGASYLHPANVSIGQFTTTSNATNATINAFNAGIVVYGGSTAGTWTMPTLSDASPSSTLMGIPFWVMNPTANPLTLTAAGGQLFNGVTGKTSLVVRPGQMAMIWGAKNASGTFQWATVVSRDIMAASAPPSLGAGCGTGATITGDDGGGTLTAGTGPGSCVLSFTATRPVAPHCVITDEAGAVPAYSESTTAITLTPTASHIYDYVCAA